VGVKSAGEIEVVTGDKESEDLAEQIRELLAKG
jgi:phosphotransferase system IIB component